MRAIAIREREGRTEMTHTATVTIVRDDKGERCVVQQADPVIWLAEELMAELRDPDRLPMVPGSAVLDGSMLTFGTPGEGLGQLTYCNTGATVEEQGTTFEVFMRAR